MTVEAFGVVVCFFNGTWMLLAFVVLKSPNDKYGTSSKCSHMKCCHMTCTIFGAGLQGSTSSINESQFHFTSFTIPWLLKKYFVHHTQQIVTASTAVWDLNEKIVVFIFLREDSIWGEELGLILHNMCMGITLQGESFRQQPLKCCCTFYK